MIRRIRSLLVMIIVLSMVLTINIPQSKAQSVQVYYGYGNITGTWQQGAMNALEGNYQEGQVVPMYLRIADAADGAVYSFKIKNNYFQATSTACGFNYLSTYDTTIPKNEFLSDPSGWIGGYPELFIPFPANVGEGDLYYMDASNVFITDPIITGTGTGTVDLFIEYTVTFTADVVGTSGPVEFWWGNHLALPDTCKDPEPPLAPLPSPHYGAGAFTGNSLQSNVSGVTGLSSSGNVQLNGAVTQKANFYGFKYFDILGDGVYEYPPDYKLPDWTIELYQCTSTNPADCTMDPVLFTTTDGQGNYSLGFDFPGDGTYYFKICEILKDILPPLTGHWVNTEPGANPPCYPVNTIVVSGGIYDQIPHNFGNWYGSTAVTLSDFTANSDKKAVLVEWQTTKPKNTIGFNLYRSLDKDGSERKLLAYLDLDFDREYEYLDKKVKWGETYYYWLEALYTVGPPGEFGPTDPVTVTKKSNPRGKH